MATVGLVKGLIGSYLPASIMVLVNSSCRMLRTWRAPASPCACAQTTFTVAKRWMQNAMPLRPWMDIYYLEDGFRPGNRLLWREAVMYVIVYVVGLRDVAQPSSFVHDDSDDTKLERPRLDDVVLYCSLIFCWKTSFTIHDCNVLMFDWLQRLILNWWGLNPVSRWAIMLHN